jgi:hypothetical protein
MRNQLLLIVFALCFTGLSQAQRLDDVDFNHTYLQLPTHPLQGDFKTYSVMIKPGGVNFAKMGMVESSMKENYFALSKYQYVTEGGDFIILVTLDGDFLVSKTLKKAEVTEGKDEAAKKVTYFSYEVKTRLPISYAIYDGERKLMQELIFSPYDRVITNSFGKETSAAALDKAWNNSGAATMDGWVKADFIGQMQALSGHLKSRYDTYPVTRKVKFYTLKNADKIGYQEMGDAVLALKPVVEGATVDKPLSLADFGANIATWEKALANVDPNDKKVGFAFQMAAFNLAMANALTGKYEAASAFAERIGETGRKEFIAKAVTDLIADRRAREQANANIPGTYAGKLNPAAHELFVAEHRAGAVSGGGMTGMNNADDYIILQANKDTLKGVVTYNFKTVRDAVSFQGAWVENVVGGEVKKRYVDVQELLALRKNGTEYFPVFVGLGIIGVTTLQEPLYYTDGLMLTRINEGESAGSFFFLHRVENKKGEDGIKVYALNDGLSFLNVNKGLANKFEDCPTIVQKANNNYYKKNETSLREVVDDYSSCQKN